MREVPAGFEDNLKMTVSTSLVVMWFGREVGDITKPSRELNMSIHQEHEWRCLDFYVPLDNTVVRVEALSGTKSCRWFDSPCGGGSRQGLVTDVVFILAPIGDRGQWKWHHVDSVGWSFLARVSFATSY